MQRRSQCVNCLAGVRFLIFVFGHLTARFHGSTSTDLYPNSGSGWFWKRLPKWKTYVQRYGLHAGSIKPAMSQRDENELAATGFDVRVANVLPFSAVSVDIWLCQCLCAVYARNATEGLVGDASARASFKYCLHGQLQKLPTEFCIELRLCVPTSFHLSGNQFQLVNGSLAQLPARALVRSFVWGLEHPITRSHAQSHRLLDCSLDRLFGRSYHSR